MIDNIWIGIGILIGLNIFFIIDYFIKKKYFKELNKTITLISRKIVDLDKELSSRKPKTRQKRLKKQ